ncbi:hypothetical protein [Methanoregula sp.]|uniref:hypothetical protein n=1 Tax=Methanoregula sp. TaxID=2052170 RepID=UPI002372BCC7|nr:hypothetical protein [Methanoregula sp.]MDD1686870.1 hypothetical protein [Methanoregula sp.]
MINWIRKFFSDFKDGQKKYYSDIKSIEEKQNQYYKNRIGYVVVYLGESGWDSPPTKEFSSKKRAFTEAQRASFHEPVAVFEVNLNNFNLDLGYDRLGRYGVRKEWNFSSQNPEKFHEPHKRRKANEEFEGYTHFVVYTISYGKAHNTFFITNADAHNYAKKVDWCIVFRDDNQRENGDWISEFEREFIDMSNKESRTNYEWWEYNNGRIVKHQQPKVSEI